jgi:hypothetical protein
MKLTLAKKAPESGYTHCACRDCMDTTVSSNVRKPELCRTARTPVHGGPRIPAGMSFECDRDGGDCQRDDAYEG